jgi:hypothetical protein
MPSSRNSSSRSSQEVMHSWSDFLDSARPRRFGLLLEYSDSILDEYLLLLTSSHQTSLVVRYTVRESEHSKYVGDRYLQTSSSQMRSTVLHQKYNPHSSRLWKKKK